MNITDLLYISPEIALISLACSNVLLPLFIKNKPVIIMSFTTFGVAALALSMCYFKHDIVGSAFEDSFINNLYTLKFKEFIILGMGMILVVHISSVQFSIQEIKPEFSSLLLLSIAGSFISISSRDLLVLFLGLEMQSLPAYLMASFATHSIKSSEAGLKYFILGSLGSALFLFGASLVYGSVGGISFELISGTLNSSPNIATIVGVSFIVISIMFKLSIVPFHMWTPDVYEGSPAISVMVFSSIHKIAALAVFINFLSLAIGKIAYDFTAIFKFLAVATLIVGSLGGIFQTSIKRLMAYSTILNVGYILLAIIADIYVGIWRHSFFTYIIIYAISIIGLFTLLVATFGDKSDDIKISDLAGLGKTKKAAALCISILMFSMIGIPPFAGFFGKYYIIFDLISIEEFKLAIVAIITSIVAAYYYLRIIKSIYFDEPQVSSVKLNLSAGTVIVISLCMIFVVCFMFGAADYLTGLTFTPQ